ncbi:glycoside hydrolase family 5 protein [Mixia osmundae IAM 14324]|uniref:glucan 1,3-beta-glucosidase n=1 Tax=Mixia osmundae (strain CBS 9802 / IAM 14324 / JCM 22182 / KY 12970) TaxID=764103 RepID=G7DZ37_MIXOS|nr:glycoside hydrolase family 5 protein [Mixia osmundae IAM 14324]KEI38248.1 glycoside hydrolase family 5 protein [Mixia osmundae IAM 14324]GAA95847.1 hypothetical protein E5Q_02504 [Mixia osmundae IAM 14324]
MLPSNEPSSPTSTHEHEEVFRDAPSRLDRVSQEALRTDLTDSRTPAQMQVNTYDDPWSPSTSKTVFSPELNPMHDTNAASTQSLGQSRGSSQTLLELSEPEKGYYATVGEAPANKPRSRRPLWLAAAALIMLVVILAAVLGTRHHAYSAILASSANTIGAPSSSGTSDIVWSGSNGATVTRDDGTKFVYANPFNGTFDAVPFSNTARAQADVPALNERWDYSVNKITGVNLGGWLLLEPFITPHLFEPYENDSTPAIDEWSLLGKLGSSASTVMLDHYNTFITEQDFADIAAAGLNWIRIPLPFWAIEVQGEEPFIEGVSWLYFLKAISWARKYGLRINLDFHTMPGSQNGWNHSGKYGQIGFLKGVMGISNAQRALNYVRTLTEFISQPAYASVIPMFSYLNEARMDSATQGNALIGVTELKSYHYQVYQLVRSITGTGEGSGPLLVMHDAFVASSDWVGFLSGADRLGLDRHPYLAFSNLQNNPLQYEATVPCQQWAAGLTASNEAFGLSIAGEYSLAINDCGKWVNNVGFGSRLDGTYPNATDPTSTYIASCDPWNDYTTWNQTTKQGLQLFALASMSSLQNSFFWTWKVSKSIVTGLVGSPLWSYQLGLQEGYVPANPRLANGFCASYLPAQGQTVPTSMVFSGTLAPSATGAGQGVIDPTQAASYGVWPPTTLGTISAATLLPTLTPTGKIITLAAATPTARPSGSPVASVGNGWLDAKDVAGYYTSATGCTYPDAWDANDLAVSAAYCTAAPTAR